MGNRQMNGSCTSTTYFLRGPKFTSVSTPCMRNKTSSWDTGPPLLVTLRVTTRSHLGIPAFVIWYLKSSCNGLDALLVSVLPNTYLLSSHGGDSLHFTSLNESLHVCFLNKVSTFLANCVKVVLTGTFVVVVFVHAGCLGTSRLPNIRPFIWNLDTSLWGSDSQNTRLNG